MRNKKLCFSNFLSRIIFSVIIILVFYFAYTIFIGKIEFPNDNGNIKHVDYLLVDTDSTSDYSWIERKSRITHVHCILISEINEIDENIDEGRMTLFLNGLAFSKTIALSNLPSNQNIDITDLFDELPKVEPLDSISVRVTPRSHREVGVAIAFNR